MKPDFWYYVLRWIGGFCDILDGICVVCSLGFYNPMLSYKMVFYSSERSIKRRMKVE
jgi:hypothetical protein